MGMAGGGPSIALEPAEGTARASVTEVMGVQSSSQAPRKPRCRSLSGAAPLSTQPLLSALKRTTAVKSRASAPFTTGAPTRRPPVTSQITPRPRGGSSTTRLRGSSCAG
jgi:hypothetical protein